MPLKILFILLKRSIMKICAKRTKSFRKIQREVALLFNLGKTLPIAAPILTKDKTYYYPFDEKFYVLYPFLQGQSFKDHFGERALEQAELLSQSIGDLHFYLRTLTLKHIKNLIYLIM